MIGVANCVDPLGDVALDVPLGDLKIAGHRKDFGDVAGLAEDIAENGLIWPIVVAERTVLSGERRIKALWLLKRATAPVVGVVDFSDAAQRLIAEREHPLTKPMLPSEQMRLVTQLRELENLSRAQRKWWDAAGFTSSGTYSRIKRVFDATQSEDSRLRAFSQELLNKIDAGQLTPATALGAIDDFQRNGGGLLHKGTANSRSQLVAIKNSLPALEGITTGLETVFEGGFEKSCTKAIAVETSAALGRYSARLHKIARQLRAYGTEEIGT